MDGVTALDLGPHTTSPKLNIQAKLQGPQPMYPSSTCILNLSQVFHTLGPNLAVVKPRALGLVAVAVPRQVHGNGVKALATQQGQRCPAIGRRRSPQSGDDASCRWPTRPRLRRHTQPGPRGANPDSDDGVGCRVVHRGWDNGT